MTSACSYTAAGRKRSALLFNLLSGLAFLIGGLVTWSLSFALDTLWLVPFAAGNFLYIGATDLVPEINRQANSGSNLIHLAALLVGLVFMWVIAL